MSSFFVIVVVCGIVWWVWSIAVRQLRYRQSNSADKPDVVEGLKAEERAYNKGAGWAVTGAIVGSFVGIAGFGGAISGIREEGV